MGLRSWLQTCSIEIAGLRFRDEVSAVAVVATLLIFDGSVF